MVSNALVPALPQGVAYPLVVQDYLPDAGQPHGEEMVLYRIPGSDQRPDLQSYTAREDLQQRASRAGDFLTGSASSRSSSGQRGSSPWGYGHSATYNCGGALLDTPVVKGTYVDLFF